MTNRMMRLAKKIAQRGVEVEHKAPPEGYGKEKRTPEEKAKTIHRQPPQSMPIGKSYKKERLRPSYDASDARDLSGLSEEDLRSQIEDTEKRLAELKEELAKR
jgi:hypothetical protein